MFIKTNLFYVFINSYFVKSSVKRRLLHFEKVDKVNISFRGKEKLLQCCFFILILFN
jgi:hypothetical protein